MTIINHGDITRLLASDDFSESDELEAKSATNAVPRSVWETVSAFANTYGGVIVLGVDEQDSNFRVLGVQNARQIIQNFHDQVRNNQVISTPVVEAKDIWVENVNGADIVVIRVPQAIRRQRPVFIKGQHDLAFIRRGDGDYRATPSEIDRMRREASLDQNTFDRQPLPKFTLDDFDPDTIALYRRLSAEYNPSLPIHTKDLKGFLELSQAWRQDRETGQEGPTVGGILTFGTPQAVIDLRPRHVIDYRRILLSNSPTSRWSDRVRHQGNLFQAYLQIFPRLIRSLPVPFRLEGAHRSDRPQGYDSIREAFVNLLIHTDYREQSDSVILHSDTEYVFQNPGDSIIDPSDFGKHAASFRRNPVIAQLFHNVGLADQAGSGYTRIFDEWQSLGFSEPVPLSDPVEFQFTLRLGLESFLSDEDRQFLASLGSGWTKNQATALVLARRDGSVTNQSLRAQTRLGTYEASNILTSLRGQGVLSHRGSGSSSTFYFPESTHQLSLPSDLEASQVLSSDLKNKTEDSGHKQAYDSVQVEDSGHKQAYDSVQMEDSGRKTSLNIEPLILIPEVAAIREKSRTEVRKTREALLIICSLGPISLVDLTRVLNRGERQIRRHLSELIREEKIRTTMPSLNDPDQKYELVSSDED